jgi:hypothetical protein
MPDAANVGEIDINTVLSSPRAARRTISTRTATREGGRLSYLLAGCLDHARIFLPGRSRSLLSVARPLPAVQMYSKVRPVGMGRFKTMGGSCGGRLPFRRVRIPVHLNNNPRDSSPRTIER